MYESFFESEEVIVNMEGSLCDAHLIYLDEHVRQLEDVLATPPSDERLDITIHNVVPIPECDVDHFGCYLGKKREIHSYWWAVDHEIVHAVHSRTGSTSAFWREGLAEALRGKRTHRGEESVVETIGKPGRELDYATAGHFVRWLIQIHGIEHVPALARGEPFESIYGRSIEDAAASYEADAPWSFPGDPSRCDFVPLGVDGIEVTSASIEVGCDSETAFQYLWQPSTNRTLTLETRGTFELSVSPGFGVFVLPCQLGIVLDPPDSDYLGDVLLESVDTGFPSYFGSDMPAHTVQLEPAKYLLTFVPDESVEGSQHRPETVTLGFQRQVE